MASVKGRQPEEKHVEPIKPCETPEVLTTASGIPTGDMRNIMTAGKCGPVLIQDISVIENIAHFNRERPPERVVHAKGAGAFGYFEVTHDITNYCKASVFQYIGKQTPAVVRFSTVVGEAGSADTVRDARGFAVKCYTDEGNWDLVTQNIPVFAIRDPSLFPSLNHSQKRNPQTHLKDLKAQWDFIGLCPQTLHQVIRVYSDGGIPDGYRHMDGYGVHAFKLVNQENKAVYCKFQLENNQGIKNLPTKEAEKLTASDPDYATRDLYNAIDNKNFPSWKLLIQVMTPKEAQNEKCNPFDSTKIWSEKDYPPIPVGKLVLTRNPNNYFVEVEQLAFEPGNMPPGIETSTDRLLQMRLFAYADAQRYRIGPNYQQLAVNYPITASVANYQRDGLMCLLANQGNAPNYYPNSYCGPVSDPKALEHKYKVTGEAARYNSADDDNFSQARDFYLHELKAPERQRLCENIANSLHCADLDIQKRNVANFRAVHQDFGDCVEALLHQLNEKKMLHL
ncbi:catalase isoform X2 [Microcaecilia unicolor]|uniref:Catalase n=1 Tax=Microcaecilia unicolor TaxID=1415580 RepID=A0A6P7Y1D2_9AMPH|nr:catalase-like isoform X2 [Microcaecilia unicolor]